MADVRLTAINPDDSSVVPVACNSKGELLLEEPLVVDGPQGPAGEDGPQGPQGEQGPPGNDGQDGDSFVPDPSTGSDGQVLTTNGSACSWQTPGPPLLAWRYLLSPTGTSYGVSPDILRRVFDGSPSTYVEFMSPGNNPPGALLSMPMHMVITKFELRAADNDTVIIVSINGKSEQVTAIKNAWTQFPRFMSEEVGANTQISISPASFYSRFYLSGFRINDIELLDTAAFNQMQLFSFEQLKLSHPDRLARLLSPSAQN